MKELTAMVQQMADLEQQQLELLPEKKRLEKEVFDLKIAAHNEQVDVEAVESFSVNGLWLKITGKYEEKLEEAERQARSAQSQYNLAAARLANVEAQLRHIAQTLPELTGCEDQLADKLTEKLGYLPSQEEAQLVNALKEIIRIGCCVLESGSKLEDALNTVLSLQGATPMITAVSDGQREATDVFQGQLREYKELVAQLQAQLAVLGYTLQTRQVSQDTLWDFFTDTLIGNHYDKVQQQIMQIRWQWKALLPALEHQYRQARVQWLRGLIAASNTES